MGWIIETAIDWIWTDLIWAAYNRYGLIAAATVVFGPLIMIGSLLALIFWV